MKDEIDSQAKTGQHHWPSGCVTSLYEVLVLRKNVFSGTNAFLSEGLDEEGYIGRKKKNSKG